MGMEEMPKGPEQKEVSTPDFSTCESETELIDFLYTIEGVQGSGKFYSRQEIMKQISEIRDARQVGAEAVANIVLREVTSTGNLRKTIDRLIVKRSA